MQPNHGFDASILYLRLYINRSTWISINGLNRNAITIHQLHFPYIFHKLTNHGYKQYTLPILVILVNDSVSIFSSLIYLYMYIWFWKYNLVKITIYVPIIVLCFYTLFVILWWKEKKIVWAVSGIFTWGGGVNRRGDMPNL